MDMPDLDLPPVEKMSHRKKWWIIGGLIVIFGGLAFLYLKDDALKDDSDLANVPSTVPEEENGLRFFDDISPTFHEDDGRYGELMEMLQAREDDPETWDTEEAKVLVKQFTKQLEAFQKVAAAPAIRAKERDKSLNTDPRLIPLRKCLSIVRAASIIAIEEGNVSDALLHVDTLFSMGTKQVEGAGSLIELLFGLIAHIVGIEILEGIILNESLPLDSAVQERVAAASALSTQLKEHLPVIFNAEHQLVKKMILAMEDTKGFAEEFPMILFKKNRTINKMADHVRIDKSVIGKTYQEIDTKVSARRARPSMTRMIFSGNFTGEAVLRMMFSLNMEMIAVIPHQSRIDILQVVAALKRFHQDKGQLPDALTELVPAYLAELPADRYDGGALRYDKDRAKVWCVGKNLTDDGAPAEDEGGRFKRMDDPAIQLKWLAAEAE